MRAKREKTNEQNNEDNTQTYKTPGRTFAG
jgi:hypothetical protein